jgi:integrase
MPTTNASLLATQDNALTFRMPIVPADYPDRSPVLSQAERRQIEELLTLSPRHFRAFEQQAARIARVTQPLLDVLALFQQRRPTSYVARQYFVDYLLGQVLQANTLYWGWSRPLWEAVIDAIPLRPNSVALRREPGYTTIAGPHSVLAHLAAYLFSDILYLTGKRCFPAHLLGEIVFGQEAVQMTLNQVIEPWVAMGYAEQRRERIVFTTILALLTNRHPHLEALTTTTLMQLRETNPSPEMQSRIGQLQHVLISLHLLPGEGGRTIAEHPHLQLFQEEFVVGIHPRWVAWLRAFWHQTPLSQNNRRDIIRHVLVAFRWVTQHAPHITEPSQWTRELALRYVAYVCNEATVYEYVSPLTQQRRAKQLEQRRGELLKAASKTARIRSLRRFFRCLQKYSYEVDGCREPRLAVNWNPDDALATPEHVLAQVQPNPRNVEEEAWLKLVWTACTLTAAMVKATAPGARYPLPLLRAIALVWVTGCRRSDEIRRLPLECIRQEWAPEMVDDNGVQLEPAEKLWYLRVPSNKYQGDFWTPIPHFTAEAILAWKAVRPPNQSSLPDRKTAKLTEYLFQYKGRRIGGSFLNQSLIPLLCKAAGLTDAQGNPYRDAIGRITSHRARSSTAYYLKAMGMTPYDIGKLLGHTNPNQTLPWYLKENLHQLGRMYRKANPLDRTVHALLDTNAAGRGEPCVFYYLSDSPEGRPRLCGNPNFRVCYHQLQCAECAAYIDVEMAEAIEKQPGVLHISVPIPLPEQLVEDLTKQEEGAPVGESPPPPPLPSPAFHFNTKVPARIEGESRPNPSEGDQLRTRLGDLETQLAAKGKQDARNVSIRLLKQEIGDLKKRIAELERQQEGSR